MSYQFAFTSKAQEDLKKLDPTIRKRLLKKIIALTEYDSVAHIAKALTGDFQSCYRIRVGQYRLICALEKETVTVLRVQHRSEVYR